MEDADWKRSKVTIKWKSPLSDFFNQENRIWTKFFYFLVLFVCFWFCFEWEYIDPKVAFAFKILVARPSLCFRHRLQWRNSEFVLSLKDERSFGRIPEISLSGKKKSWKMKCNTKPDYFIGVIGAMLRTISRSFLKWTKSWRWSIIALLDQMLQNVHFTELFYETLNFPW